MLYKNGGFNLAHLLAIFTILAILLGVISEKYDILGYLDIFSLLYRKCPIS